MYSKSQVFRPMPTKNSIKLTTKSAMDWAVIGFREWRRMTINTSSRARCLKLCTIFSYIYFKIIQIYKNHTTILYSCRKAIGQVF